MQSNTNPGKTPFMPAAAKTWQVLRAQHLSLDKIVEEIVDNSISAGAGNIHIRITQEPADSFHLDIWDDGIGIAPTQLPQVFGVGCDDNCQGGLYNKYGIGLKSVLASCDPDNRGWEVSSQVNGAPAIRVKAPYDPAGMEYEAVPVSALGFPEGWIYTSGTRISVPVPRPLFNSLLPKNATDDKRIGLLWEELSVTYAPRLKSISMILEWVPMSGNSECYPVLPSEPLWESVNGQTMQQDLGNGPVYLKFRYGRITPSLDNQRYYRGNIGSSGLMVYLDGRLIEHNIFREVWNLPHPTYNNFLFILDVQTDNKSPNGRDALPSPTPGKDAFLRSDSRFEALVEWARQVCPDPRRVIQISKSNESKEVARCKGLAELMLNSSVAISAETELPATLGDDGKASRTDIYARLADGRAVLIEGKVHPSKVQDVAQLAAYGLQMALDGLKLCDDSIPWEDGHQLTLPDGRSVFLFSLAEGFIHMATHPLGGLCYVLVTGRIYMADGAAPKDAAELAIDMWRNISGRENDFIDQVAENDIIFDLEHWMALQKQGQGGVEENK